MNYIVGNWKSQKTTADGKAWLKRFAELYRDSEDLQIVVAPTFVSLEILADSAQNMPLKNVSFAVQDISPFPRGSYTGAVAADLVKGVARYVIVGHSERRRYFHENMQDVLNKASEAVDVGLVPLVCIEDAAQLLQLAPLAELDGKLLFAYTPHDPVVSGKAAPVSEVEEMAAKIRRTFPAAAVLYGGGVTQENSRVYLGVEGISGLFVGGASLDAADFAAICNNI